MAELLRLSNSESAKFRRCRRAWYLGYYRRLKSRALHGPGTPISIGNAVHDALANYYDPSVKADPVKYAQAQYAQAYEDAPSQVTELQKEEQLVTIMLEGYIEWLGATGIDGDLQITGTEQMVELQLVPEIGDYGPVNLLSKLDAPVLRVSDSAKLALEHKTVGSLDAPLALLKLDTQLLTEHLVRFLDSIEKGATPEEALDQCHGILYNMLRKVKRTPSAKPPFFDRVDVPHNIHELRNHWRHVVNQAREIQAIKLRLDAGADHHDVCPPSPRRDCSWDCDFFKVCVMADDGSDFEGALAALYEEHDPLERYFDTETL